jgi:hypothetical protein
MDDRTTLERSVRFWRLVSFGLAVHLVASVAIGGTVNLMLLLETPTQRELMMRAEEERDRAEVERANALQVLQKAEQLKREMEAAKKNNGNPP